MRRIGYIFTLALVLALCATASFAQDGKLKIKVTPPQAYVFVDGNAIRDGSQSIKLPAGKHTVVVVNYGYKISTQDVNIEAGKSTDLAVTLEALRRQGRRPLGPCLYFGDGRTRRGSFRTERLRAILWAMWMNSTTISGFGSRN